ncbi:zinc finger, CCHC-type containing protein, partial [Tanacetum coccineum]
WSCGPPMVQEDKVCKSTSSCMEGYYKDVTILHVVELKFKIKPVGIIHETTAPYTPQQNGVAERKNRALKEMVNSMLSYSGLSEGFWGESIAVVRLPDPKRKTLGEKGIDCIFVGYAKHSKGSRDQIGSQYSYCYSIEEYPRTYSEAIQYLDSAFWKKEIDDEIGSIMENNTWVLSDLPPGCKPLGFRQKERIDYFDTYAPVARITTIRLLLALVATHNLVMSISKFDGSGKGVIICLYVDDMLIFGTDQNQVDKTKKFLSSKFSMKDMGEADVILGIKIKRENKGIVITQSHYIEKILKKFNREYCSPVSTPMDPVEKLMPNTGKPVDQLEYSRAIGCLMYAMTSTRPDIAYAVGRLSRFTSNPSRHHWHAITRVFKYLKGTMNYGLSYVGYPSVLEGYSDASWINHVEDSSSTSGWVFLLGGGAISWASKKQTCITSSTMESEFVALAAAGKEAEWLKT